MRVAIVVFPGSNCDRDIFEAIKSISKKLPKFIWHKETNIENFDKDIFRNDTGDLIEGYQEIVKRFEIKIES